MSRAVKFKFFACQPLLSNGSRVYQKIRASQVELSDQSWKFDSWATSKSSSRKPRRSSHSGLKRSGKSSLAFARTKEAAPITELEAKDALLEKWRSLEEQKLSLQQKQERLTPEAELANSKPKKQIFIFTHGSCPAFVCAESNKLGIQRVWEESWSGDYGTWN